MTNKLKLLDEVLVGASWTDEEAIIIIALRREVLSNKSVQEAEMQKLKEEVKELPPMQRPPGKKLKSIDVPCPACKAEPGERCFIMSRGGGNNAKIQEPREYKPGGFHPRRVDKAGSQRK